MPRAQAKREREFRTARSVEAYVLGEQGQEIPVVLTDISNRGCRIHAAEGLKAGDRVRIEVPRLGGMAAHIRWLQDGDAGAEFVPESDVWEDAAPGVQRP